jgi:hypothetical protein
MYEPQSITLVQLLTLE